MPRFMFGVCALLLLPFCGEQQDAAHTYQVRGVYVGPQYAGQAALINHERIPGYMDAMRMAFRVQDPAELQPFSPGDKIQFDLVVTADNQYIQHLERLPEDVVLDLAEPAQSAP